MCSQAGTKKMYDWPAFYKNTTMIYFLRYCHNICNPTFSSALAVASFKASKHQDGQIKINYHVQNAFFFCIVPL